MEGRDEERRKEKGTAFLLSLSVGINIFVGDGYARCISNSGGGPCCGYKSADMQRNERIS